MRNFLVFISVILLTSVSSCRKYEDGPDLSLSSKDARLKGVWDVELYYINGNDSTGAVKNQPCYFPFFFKGLTYETINLVVDNTYPYDTSCSCNGRYTLKDNDNKFWLKFQLQGSNLLSVGPLYDNGGNFSAGKATEWKINRLTNNEFWIETVWNNMYCILHLKKIKSVQL